MTKYITAVVFFMALPEFRRLPRESITTLIGALSENQNDSTHWNLPLDGNLNKSSCMHLLNSAAIFFCRLKNNPARNSKQKKGQPWKVGQKGH